MATKGEPNAIPIAHNARVVLHRHAPILEGYTGELVRVGIEGEDKSIVLSGTVSAFTALALDILRLLHGPYEEEADG